ncbi:MAG: hypothetical protein JSR31_12910 [Nitrospira sp.]|nr:hypothetical protein [Nitrospira sp.]
MYLFVIMVVALLVGQTDKASAISLTVIEFSRSPNYALCTDDDDPRQLTDGKLAMFPIWMNKEAVGWAAFTPVAIQLRVGGGSSIGAPQAGRLRLHSAKGLSAGVDVPQQINVYTRDRADKLRMVGSLAPESAKLEDSRAHWLEIDVSAVTDTLVVVLHASGTFLFLDEIEWHPSAVGNIPATSPIIANVRTALEDSKRRTRETLLKTADIEIERRALSLDGRAMHVWIQNPWGVIDPARARDHIEIGTPAVEIRGYAGERESVCFGIVVGEAAGVGGLSVKVKGLPVASVRLFEVMPVIAANGQRVYDPLVPLNDGMRLTMRPGVPSYIWLDVNLAIIGPGSHRFQISIEGGGQTISVPGAATIMAYDGNGTKPLYAVNWAYSSDLPIFRDRNAAVNDLVTHGINTFVAHPAEIPGLAMDGSWDINKAVQFAGTVDLAKQRGTLFLYLGWSAVKNPLGFSDKGRTLDPAAKERLLKWIEKVSAYLAAQGLPPERWVLYPVDEPDRPSLQLIKAVAEAVKQWNPAIRVYANPSVYANPPINIDHLRELQGLVDLWQPNLLAVHGHLGEFFKHLQKEWWIYGNTKAPAKLGSPLHDYRLLAWWAWHYGASGIGFWSYSDTSGSSAWDDIDGPRPDWAVVYESDKGVVSSRRWEAFREGLEDYVLLTAFNRAEVQKAMHLPGEADFSRWESSNVEAVRRVLLDGSVKPLSHGAGR